MITLPFPNQPHIVFDHHLEDTVAYPKAGSNLILYFRIYIPTV